MGKITSDPDSVFEAVEAERGSGTLAKHFTTGKIRYVMSESHPGYLEQIDIQGVHTVGEFKDGEFVPFDDDA
jgi:hypothetical protein